MDLLTDELSCAICYEIMQNPMSLLCNHSVSARALHLIGATGMDY